MKKVWMIYRYMFHSMKYTGISFSDEKAANDYCELSNQQFTDAVEYYCMPIDVYDSVEDYKKLNEEIYRTELFKGIEALHQKTTDPSVGFEIFVVDNFHNNFTLEEIKKIMTGDNYKEFTVGKNNGEFRFMTKEDLPFVQKEYERVLKEIEEMKTKLNGYSKEYFTDITNKRKKNTEDSDLTK